MRLTLIRVELASRWLAQREADEEGDWEADEAEYEQRMPPAILVIQPPAGRHTDANADGGAYGKK